MVQTRGARLAKNEKKRAQVGLLNYVISQVFTTFSCFYALGVCMYVCMYVCVHVQMYVCMSFVCMCICQDDCGNLRPIS